MNIFESITDMSLRRLYKFILKQLLSPILKDELTLEQIKLASRDGKIELKDLSLDSNYLNAYIASVSSSLRVRSCEVRTIAAKISYSNILEDGVSFEVRGVEIHLEPQCLTSSESENNQPNLTTGIKSTDSQNKRGKSQELDAEGLKFLASWIEIIIAKLSISVEDIVLFIHHAATDDGDGSKEEKEIPILTITLDQLKYFNSHPQDRIVGNAVDLSTRFQGNKSSVLQNLGKRKVVFICFSILH